MSMAVNLSLLLSMVFLVQSYNRTINNSHIEKMLQLEADDPTSEFTFLIAGGLRNPVIMKKFLPYMVSIRSRNPQKYFGDNHFCSGTIFGKDLVLTAAHCVMDKRRVLTKPRRLLLVAGTPNRVEPSNTTVQYPARSLTAHTNFVRKNRNDIAVIRLKGEVPEKSDSIKAIKLPSGPPPYGSQCIVLGWGRLCRDGPLSGFATHLRVKLYTPEECQRKLPNKFKEGMLCAGEDRPFKQDPCRGDSGGPLICNDTLTGIISWTIGCGSFYAASLYTDVWYNRQWIDQHISKAYHLKPHYFVYVLLLLLWIL
uniref:Peptidase S1 domain-containing protein n=1 Tax=Stomoxys calcitrans TaxID=35570 RepID=A0A1I8PM31_STOCA